MRLLIIALLVASLFIFGCSSEATNDQLAQCLTDKGAVMYGTQWCGHCQNQKAAFGESFEYIDFVDCGLDQQRCIEAGVHGVPTWSIDGVNYPGEQSLDRLADLAEC